MYVLENKIRQRKLLAEIQLIIGWIGAVFWLAIGIVGMGEERKTGTDVAMIVVCLLFTALFTLMVVSGYRKKRCLNAARQIEWILKNAPATPVAAVAQRLGRTVPATLRQIQWLLNRGLLTNCALEGGNVPMLRSRIANGPAAPVSVRCPACGGTTLLPRNGSGVCDYCGSAIHAGSFAPPPGSR